MTIASQAQLSTSELLAALEGVTAIPVVPYRNGSVDYEAHLKNVRYLMQNNRQSENRPRVLSIAGTSPIHQMTRAEHVRLVDITTQAMGHQGVYVAGVLPNPLAEARETISELAALERSPDAYLIMPLAGVYDPDSMYVEFMALGEEMNDRFGARFIYYFKDGRDIAQMENLFRDLGCFCRRESGHERGRRRAAQARARRQRSPHLGHRRPQHARGPTRFKGPYIRHRPSSTPEPPMP